ncbi:MAG: DUF924 family protein [Pseudomonadota bacterium]
MTNAQEVVQFWCHECAPADWYKEDPELDATIRDRFGPDVVRAQQGELDGWAETAEGALALIILIDQFSRNIFRGDARSFAGDDHGLALARQAVARDFDTAYDMPVRQFFLLPFLHSEILADQDEGLQLMQDRLGPDGANNVLHARAHREIIRRFGRFPYRNAVLNRDTTADEQAFLDGGSYGAVLREVQSRYPTP